MPIPTQSKDSLGKLPPQALDLEESVLGGLMLEKAALSVLVFLRPPHFYTEAHSKIFQAICELHKEGQAIDMRTVVAQLRRTGHLELVGGATEIATLTSKVSSTGNIEMYARIIVEHYIKRETIRISSQIGSSAYEDTTDALALLSNVLAQFQHLNDTTLAQSAETITKAAWTDRLITEEPPEVPPLVRLGSIPLATPENHSLIVGKKKSRKSLYVTWEVSEYFKQNKGASQDEVMIFDTEQGKRHVWKYGNRIKRLTGKQIPIFFLRGQSPQERRELITNTIKFWPTKIKILVIDGIRDLMMNINDADECSDLLAWLERMILQYNVHVINILHLNKTDNNARGHIGSELLNKAEITVELELDDKTGCSIVRCENSREKSFEPWAFTHSDEGLPIIVDAPVPGTTLPVDETKRRLEFIFGGEKEIKYKQLVEGLQDHLSIGANKAQRKIADFIRLGWVVKHGIPRSPDSTYQLMTSSNGVDHEPQTTMFVEPKPVEDDNSDLPF